LTILLASGKRPNGVQHLAGHASIQPTLEHDMHWIPSMGKDTADGMAEVLGSG
jgi:murein endopeptidase